MRFYVWVMLFGNMLLANAETVRAEITEAMGTESIGAIFGSEADYPFEYVSVPLDANDTQISEQLLRFKLASVVDSHPDESVDRPMSELFASQTPYESLKKDFLEICSENNQDYKNDCAQLRKLFQGLEKNLKNIQVYYFGQNGSPGIVHGVGVSMFIVGVSEYKTLTGVRLTQIWS